MKIKVVYDNEVHKNYLSDKKRNKNVLYVLRFIKQLEDDTKFEKTVSFIRKRSEIDTKDKSNLNYKDAQLEALKEDFGDVTNLRLIIQILCEDYDISFMDWWFSFHTFIKYNFMYPPVISDDIKVWTGKELYKFYKNKKYIKYFPLKNTVYLAFYKYINKTTFLKLMHQYYDEIFMSIPKSTKPPLIRPNLIRNIEMYKKIRKLKNDGKKTNEIADSINDIYNKAFSEDEIRIMAKRYQKSIESLRPNKHKN